MQLNPDLLFRSPGSAELLQGLRERLEQAAYWLSPVSVIGLHIDNKGLAPGSEARLLESARKLVGRSVRSESNSQRRITDAVFRVDSFLFAVLFNADRQNYLIPTGRIIESLRAEAAAIVSIQGTGFKRQVIVGSATWVPNHGATTPEAQVGRVLEALMMALALPQVDTYERLGIAASEIDDVRLYEYSWDDATFTLKI